MATARVDTQLQGITDLTLLAPIKPGFVTTFDTISYVERTRRVLQVLNALRLGARESTNPPSPYTDVVQKFRIVHSFRWALIEPKPGSGEPTRLLLNVCFDGGWEPYMRVIWRDLGSMLDLILCGAEGYPLAKASSFEHYIQWVREMERSSDFLYLDSGLSSSDHEYLAALERQQREKNPADAALAATQLHTPAPGVGKPFPPPYLTPLQAAMLGLTPLAGLYTLERYFLKGQPEGLCLIRAARDILSELNSAQQFPAGHPVRIAYSRMLAWFEQDLPPVTVKPRQLDYDARQIQGGMLSGYPSLSCGVMVLLRVSKRAEAIAWLGQHPFTSEEAGTQPPAGGLYRNVALSLAGLRALGVPQSRLDRFPQAFREGMEARAGVLGDLRHNHPKYWKLPPRNWPDRQGQQSVNLGSVHLLIQLRSQAALDDEGWKPHIAELEQGSGLQVLSVQAMRRNTVNQQTVENFGFVDGVSQPTLDAPPGRQPWDDNVKRGELLLGYPTRHDDHAVPEAADALLDQGSFLVVRKLRQQVKTLYDQLDAQAAALGLPRDLLLSKMMGRKLDGTPLGSPIAGPLADNNFSYQDDAKASGCPFHAHVRRANPREGPMPRILRRGMSYGSKYEPGKEAEDRGLIFMAYNANISEQFETIQRWLAGGNSSGAYSGQSDPFLGVTPATERRIYRFEAEVNGQAKAIHLDLGNKPFVELQWGAYFFVPSLPALRNLPALVELPQPAAIAAPLLAPALDDFMAWQQWLEDTSTRDTAWAYVRSQPGGVLRSAYGVLVGDPVRVCDVFRDVHQRYSVGGYGERMSKSVGLGFLGMDDSADYREQAPAINKLIESIQETEAFSEARTLTAARLAALRAGGAPIDLEQLSEHVLAGLCTHWFGLPDAAGQFMWDEDHAPAPKEPPRCPRGFFAVSRYVFGPHPSAVVQQVGPDKGQALLEAVRQWLASKPAGMPALSKRIVAELKPLEKVKPGITARTLTGVILGFPPTVHGNLLSTLVAWVGTRKLWDLQLDLGQSMQSDSYARAVEALRPTLLATMMRQPVPAMVWRRARTAHKLGPVDVTVGEKIVVGIVSATQTGQADHYTMFGGDRHDAIAPAPLHACSGYAMAMGVMLGVAAALLEAGTLRPTPSPAVLNLDA